MLRTAEAFEWPWRAASVQALAYVASYGQVKGAFELLARTLCWSQEAAGCNAGLADMQGSTQQAVVEKSFDWWTA